MFEKKCSLKKDGYEFNYIVNYPERFEVNLPVLLFLHGIGERGNSIDDIKRYSFPNYISNMDIPYVCISPQCSNNNFWDYHLRDVEEVLKKVIEEYSCDPDRVCIMGSSMGACGAWNYIMQRPDLFKCLISASGRAGLPIEENIKRIINKSFLIYHGTCDDVISYTNSIEIYNALKRYGAKDVELKLIDGESHFVCSTAYKDPNLYKWLRKKL